MLVVLKVAIEAGGDRRAYVPPISSQAEIQRFAKTKLGELQERSFVSGVEYCGMIFEDLEGNLSASEVFRGDKSSCGYEFSWAIGQNPVGSFHTHGGFEPEFDNEVPSLTDLESEIESQVHGYVSTPGGRFWHVDWQEETVTQVCGERCLPQDKKYRACPAYAPSSEYDEDSLRDRMKTDPTVC